jgi:hypothetical protein
MTFSRATFILGVLLLLGLRAAQGQVSVYATYGDYSRGGWSKEGAAYATLAMKNRNFFTLGFSDERMTRTGFHGVWRSPEEVPWRTDFSGWTYHQQMAVAGFSVTDYPVRVRAYLAHLGGDYRDRDSTVYRTADTAYTWRSATSPAGYRDAANIGSVEVGYVRFPFEAGVEVASYRRGGATYDVGTRTQVQYGLDSVLWDTTVTTATRVREANTTTQQITLRLEWAVTPVVGLSVRPSFSKVSDGRELYSVSGKLSLAPHRNLGVRAGGTVGERASYFDNDLLVIYNQLDTQRSAYFAQVETRVWRQFVLTAEYIKTRFHDVPAAGIPGRDYSISYIVAGIKTQIAL